MVERIIIIGAGQAGVSLAFKLRDLKYDGHILLIGDEPDLPYYRPPLSKKYVTQQVGPEKLHLRPRALYESQRIELLAGRRVARIDRAGRQVVMADGETLPYDLLALTVGASPRRLPAGLGGDAVNVHTLRSLADARKLRDAFALGGHLLVVGGGYIGLETAAVARYLGMRVTLVEQAQRILMRVAAGETADYFRALHRAEGVEILEGVGLESVDVVDGRVVRARLGNGETLAVDVVVAGIGVVPHTDLAAAAGLQIDNGIAVDGAGRTSDPAIFAAGDCASFPYAGRRIRLESVQNAIDQAEVVAAAMMNFPADYRPTPWFWSDQYATKLQIAGLNHGFTRVVRRPGTRDGVSVWYFAGEEFLAVDAINDPKAFMTARQWLAAGRKPRFAELADPARELSAIATP